MPVEVVITGIGLRSALGNLTQSWRKILGGESGITRHLQLISPTYPLALLGQLPISVLDLTQQVLTDALLDAGLTLPLPDWGVVVGSSRSQQAVWEQCADRYFKEQAFPDLPWLDTLPHRISGFVAQHIQAINRPVLSPMAACATGIWSIAQGYELIAQGVCQRVIAGAVEAPITPLTLAGFQQMGALAQTGSFPFDRRREGLVLGEGGALFVLESAEAARQRQAKIYGQILGFGLTADAFHVCASQMNSPGAIAAIRHCLQRSGISADQVDYIHAHGTATPLNDQVEANLITTLFPASVAVSSTKGATGHTLGASGALGIAWCLMALKHQILPPCIGLTTPEFALNFVESADTQKIEKTLCFSFGFGGQNAVIALGKNSES